MITEEQLAKEREVIPFTSTKRLKRDDILYVTEKDIPHPIYGYAKYHKEYSVIDLRGYRKGYEPRLEISGTYTPNPEDIFRLQTGKLPPYQPTTTGDKLLAEMRRLGVHKAFRIDKPSPVEEIKERGNPEEVPAVPEVEPTAVQIRTVEIVEADRAATADAIRFLTSGKAPTMDEIALIEAALMDAGVKEVEIQRLATSGLPAVQQVRLWIQRLEIDLQELNEELSQAMAGKFKEVKIPIRKPPAVEVVIEHRGTEPEGIAIADKLGVRYDGIQKEIGMQFTDIRGTGSTFYATSMEDAREELRKQRRLFGMAEGGNPIPEEVPLQVRKVQSMIERVPRDYDGHFIDYGDLRWRDFAGNQTDLVETPDGRIVSVGEIDGKKIYILRLESWDDFEILRTREEVIETLKWGLKGKEITEANPPAVGDNPIPEELDLVRTLAIIDSRPKAKIIESKLREEFGDAVIDALRQGHYVVSGSAGYNPPLLVSLKGRELIQGGNPTGKVITEEEAIGLLERLSMTPGEAARSLVADEAERREIMRTVQQRVKREQNKWAPMDPREGPPLPRIFAGLRWPWKK